MASTPTSCIGGGNWHKGVRKRLPPSRASSWRSPAGLRAGKRATAVMSLIHSAKLNELDPYVYMRDVLERLPTQPASRIKEMLPHRCQLASIQSACLSSRRVGQTLTKVRVSAPNRVVSSQIKPRHPKISGAVDWANRRPRSTRRYVRQIPNSTLPKDRSPHRSHS